MVDLARMRHRLLDRVLGDGVEHHALDGLVLERALLVQYVEQMPGNGLALAIRIGRENDLVGFFDEFGDGGDALGALGVHLPDHREIVFRVDRAVLGGQVADMAVAGDHVEIAAEIFVDCLCLGRRFDDDDVHINPPLANPPTIPRGLDQRRPDGGGDRAGTWSSRPPLSNARGNPKPRKAFAAARSRLAGSARLLYEQRYRVRASRPLARPWGLVAEWLRRGLQILVRGFNSLRGLQKIKNTQPRDPTAWRAAARDG